MPNIVVPFVPRPFNSADEQVYEFIRHVRTTAVFFKGPNAIDWEEDVWDLTPFFPKRANVKTKAIFSIEPFEKEPFPQPFLDEAKALLADFLQCSKNRQASNVVGGLRYLFRALSKECPEPSIVALDDQIIEGAADIIAKESPSPSGPAKLLERIVNDHIQKKRLSKVSLTWKSSFKYERPNRSNIVTARKKVTDSGRMKLPQLGCVLDLASVFRSSDYPADQVVSAWFAIAMAAPSRIAEILTLPVDCLTRADMEGQEVTGIKWEPVKDGMPMTKFTIGEESTEVLIEAVERLRVLGQQARKAAKWYEDNPGQIYLPDQLEKLRGKPVTLDEVALILGRHEPISRSNVSSFKFKKVGRTTDSSRFVQGSRATLYDYESIEKFILARLPEFMPFADSVTRLRYSQALFTLPYSIMGAKKATCQFIPQFISPQIIAHELGNDQNGVTIFSRNNLINPETGEPWKLQTHQPRHLLNTLAQSKYLSQELIAFWSGRRNVQHNEFYDHLTPEAKLEAWSLLDDGAPGQLKAGGSLGEKVSTRALKELREEDEILREEVSAFHKTQYGFCRHNFALTPCPKDKWCNNCGEAFFVKGAAEQIRSTEADIALMAAAIGRCHAAIQEGEGGVEDWLERYQYDLDRYQTKLQMLTDPEIEDGTLLTLPPPQKSQSKAGLSLELRNQQARKRASKKGADEGASTLFDLLKA